nr:extensin-like [Lolium perenne]
MSSSPATTTTTSAPPNPSPPAPPLSHGSRDIHGGGLRRRSPPLAAGALDGHPRPRHRGPGHPPVPDRHPGDDHAAATPGHLRLLGRVGVSALPGRARPAPAAPPPAPWSPGPPVPGAGPASLPQGVPIQQVPFPPSPSQLPAWVTATAPPPVYPTAPAPPPVYTTAGDPLRPSFPELAYSRFAEPYAGRAEYPGQGTAAPNPPRYAKLDFATYDGVEDPLNWLNQCEQFFRGQCTLASAAPGSPRTTSAAPPRHAELGRLAFTTTVQDFADRFQALACHAPGVTGPQRAELFIGGLPDHIRVDVELQAPQDL